MADPRDEDVDPRYSPVFQRGYDPQRDGISDPGSESEAEQEPEPTPATESTPDPTTQSDAASDPAPDAAAPRSPRALAIATGVLSAVLLVAGIALVFVGPSGTGSTIDFSDLLAEALSPALVLGGGIGLALTALLAAIGMRRDR